MVICTHLKLRLIIYVFKPNKFVSPVFIIIFYKNLSDCIRNAITCETIKENKTRHYIKIFKNSDVVQEIRNTSTKLTYGYLHLCVKHEMNTDHIYLFSPCNILLRSMLCCVTCAKFKKMIFLRLLRVLLNQDILFCYRILILCENQVDLCIFNIIMFFIN